MKATDIFQIKVTLSGSSPSIWRRIQVPGNTSLSDLHDILQTVMGWQDSHLHVFIVNGEQYGTDIDSGFEDDELPPAKDESKMTLAKIAKIEKRLIYEYDFGDSWRHEIEIETRFPATEHTNYPACIGGENACPPEDCGGMGGYGDLVRALADPSHEEHDSLKIWVGGFFDPKTFDPNRINRDFLWN
jgi:hypothetical protein